MKIKYKYIYGPVYSWRLGRSLGIDPVSCEEKICTFDCLYCQLGRTNVFSEKRKEFVPIKKVIEEIKSLPPVRIDYISFSGRGEPTLAKNLGGMIKAVKKIRKEKIAVITNSSLIYRKDVRTDLCLGDLVMLKLDACSEEAFFKINGPRQSIRFADILKGIAEFKSEYGGRLALQVMFTEENMAYAEGIAQLARSINPDEVQINTPLRPSQTRALSRKELDSIKAYFEGMNVTYVYKGKKKNIAPVDQYATLRRRGISHAHGKGHD